MEQTRSDMRNPFVDTEGLAVMSTYTPPPIFIIPQYNQMPSSEKKRVALIFCSDRHNRIVFDGTE